MLKKANTSFSINTILENRWSPRAFADKKVDKETLQRILEACRWSPSCFNEQPWQFIIGQKNSYQSTYDKILNSLTTSNQVWAKTADILMLACGRKYFKQNNKENNYTRYDVGQSVAHLTFQAMTEGVFVHQMAGFSVAKVIEEFNIPSEVEPISVIALGYLGSPDILPTNLKEKEIGERNRQALELIFFTEEYGKPL